MAKIPGVLEKWEERHSFTIVTSVWVHSTFWTDINHFDQMRLLDYFFTLLITSFFSSKIVIIITYTSYSYPCDSTCIYVLCVFCVFFTCYLIQCLSLCRIMRYLFWFMLIRVISSILSMPVYLLRFASLVYALVDFIKYIFLKYSRI